MTPPYRWCPADTDTHQLYVSADDEVVGEAWRDGATMRIQVGELSLARRFYTMAAAQQAVERAVKP